MATIPKQITAEVVNELFEHHVRHKVSELKRLDLLEGLVKIVSLLFATDDVFKPHRTALGDDEETVQKTVHAANNHCFTHVEDGSDLWFAAAAAVRARTTVLAGFVLRALRAFNGFGFNAFEQILIETGAKMCRLTDNWAQSWGYATRLPNVMTELESLDKSKLSEAFMDHHTIIHRNTDGKLVATTYAEYFVEDMSQLANQLLSTIDSLKKLEKNELWDKDVEQHIVYFDLYRSALLETDVSLVAKRWDALDEHWVDMKFWIQIVHDQEYGYAEPLRTKVAPDFTLVFVDERIAAANAHIAEVKSTMLTYLEARKAKGDKLAIDGLRCLSNTFASINYIPMMSGYSAMFRWLGSSLPNNSRVLAAKGGKLYFNPAAGDVAHKLVVNCTKLVVREDQVDMCIKCYDPIEFMAFCVAPHECMHAIYPLHDPRLNLPSEVSSLLEEGRAELGAVLSMRLLHQKGYIDDKTLERLILSYLLHDFRYVSFVGNAGAKAYTLSAIFHFALYEQTGYITLQDESKLSIDLSKTRAVVDALADLSEETFTRIEANDVQWLQNTLKKFEEETPLVKWLVVAFCSAEL